MTHHSVVAPEELEYFVKSIKPFSVVDIGSSDWIQSHEIVLKLSQQAHIEVTQHQEEAVKEFLVIDAKLPVLVHELYTVVVWRCKVLPRLLEIEPNPTATFMLYTVLFHEATALSLIEISLFHQNGCESLADSALDLIDYCLQSLTQLIGLANVNDNGRHSATETTVEELERQKRDLLYKIGISCVSVLCYIVDKIDVLPLSVVTRLIHTHDTPCVLSEILHCRPWHRRTTNGIELMIDNEWKPSQGEDLARLTKTEAQTWLCFRQLMFNGNVAKAYAINEFRQRELAKCQGLLNDQLIDQLPPLAEFKHYLCTLQLSTGNRDKRAAFQLEELPQIKDAIMAEAKQIGYKEIARRQANIFLNKSAAEIMQLAQRLNSAYGSDTWERMEEPLLSSDANHVCGRCARVASKKCFQCGEVYYCGRECQVIDWPQHKPQCRQRAE